MARLYRLRPDSSYLIAPRIFSRVFCDTGTLPDIVRFYETLTSTTLDMDMDILEGGLHVVAVGPVRSGHEVTILTAAPATVLVVMCRARRGGGAGQPAGHHSLIAQYTRDSELAGRCS